MTQQEYEGTIEFALRIEEAKRMMAKYGKAGHHPFVGYYTKVAAPLMKDEEYLTTIYTLIHDDKVLYRDGILLADQDNYAVFQKDIYAEELGVTMPPFYKGENDLTKTDAVVFYKDKTIYDGPIFDVEIAGQFCALYVPNEKAQRGVKVFRLGAQVFEGKKAEFMFVHNCVVEDKIKCFDANDRTVWIDAIKQATPAKVLPEQEGCIRTRRLKRKER